MDSWVQIAENYWRKESDIPIGHVVAEIRKQGSMALYTTRVEVSFVDQRLPRHMIKNSVGLQSQAEAQGACNALVAEAVAAEVVVEDWFYHGPHLD